MRYANFVDAFRDYVSKVGACANCMRQSAIAACVTALATPVAYVLSPQFGFPVTAAAAVAATALFATHIYVFARRRVLVVGRSSEATLSRRAAFRTLFGAAGAGVLLVAMDRPTFAGSPCGGYSGECDPCSINRYLNGDPSGCITCKSCSRGNNRCTGAC